MIKFSDFDKIKIGDTRELVKEITEADIQKFVQLTGDTNPLHINQEFASKTSFKNIVVHGLLGASFVSTVIGTKLPGPGALWLSQNFEFLLPVRLGDILTVSCTVAKKHDRERLLDLDTLITNQNRQIILKGDGRVKMLISTAPEESAEKQQGLSPVALVTGGSGGIGAAICRRLASDGFHVVLNFNHNKSRAESIVEAIIASGGNAVSVQADVSTEDGAAKLADRANHHFGSVGVLVNNASPRINPKSLANMTWDDMQRHFDVQLKSAFFLTQLCGAEMKQRQSGRVINITSQIVRGMPTPNWTSYSVAKSALANFSRQMAAEFGPTGVTVNCVAPGMTETALIGDIPPKQQMVIGRQTPMRRLAQPEDIAATVAYFASDDAKFVTGHTLDVNGGMFMS